MASMRRYIKLMAAIFLFVCLGINKSAASDSAARITQAIDVAGIPIDGVAILDESTHQVRIDFKSTATSPQRIQAQAIVNSFDWTAGSAIQQSYTDEINGTMGNDLCNAELSDIDTKIDAGINTITDLATAKTFLRVALKKITRCLRARAR